MLGEKNSGNTVAWSPAGDSFFIRDQVEFARVLLPKHFKHNNFASFVRQLNKYDFHKVKTNEGPKGKPGAVDLAWEFKHPNFTRDGFDQLNTVRRKAPTSKKGPGDGEPKSVEDLQTQIESLNAIQKDMANFLQTLSRNYESVVREVVAFKKTIAGQDQLIQNLLQYLVTKDAASPAAVGTPSPIALATQSGATQHGGDKKHLNILEAPTAFSLAAQTTSQLDSTPGQAAQRQHNLFVPQGQQTPSSLPPNLSNPGDWNLPPEIGNGSWALAPENLNSTTVQNFQNVAQVSFAQMEEMGRRSAPTGTVVKPEDALTVHSVGILRPKQQGAMSGQNTNSMRIIRETFVPGWSVPPKVLLVDDDATSQLLASKLLKVMGCTYEVAKDGMEAVTKMNLEKYDMVLMDIVMPHMDGISATTQIRQFDNSTPVISMTSNTSREDCISYLSNGMNDILPKPFSRDSVRHTYKLLDLIGLTGSLLFFFFFFSLHFSSA